MELLLFLIVFPLVAAAVLLVVKDDRARDAIVWATAAIVAAASIVLAVRYFGRGWTGFAFSSVAVDTIAIAVGALIAIVVMVYGVKHRNGAAIVLAAIQLVSDLIFEFVFAHQMEVPVGLYVDQLSVIMALIIGIIGSGICVYALGYMKDYQAHRPEGEKDRRPAFFALMVLFLSAMFIIVFSNNLVWMFTGWEVTTLCSFLLIGFTRTDEAIKNAFRQIIMNMIGGLGFLVAMYFGAIWLNTLSFNEFIIYGLRHPELIAVPLCAFSLAGLTKAAQMPFHTWLLGAMVAPTPTSALLHSSTMVKAGVFLLIKLAPLYTVCFAASQMVILVGGITFMLCSFMAISQSNAKRVLAYSTIANLGLIVACAGVGTPEAIWAAILLMIFHAAAKSLLFLCVGTAEHHIGSRDIESMDLLFERMPRLARLMMVGIMGMFIAPFGMLIAKWATLVSFVENGQLVLVMLLAFGSAATFMFWAKWLGKLAGIAGQQEDVELSVHRSEWASMGLMAFIAVAACVLLPLLSNALIEPYIIAVYGQLGRDIPLDDLWISAVLALFTAAVFIGALRPSKRQKQGSVYLSGVMVDSGTRVYRNSLSSDEKATARNLYLEAYFNEGRFKPVGEVLCAAVIVFAFVASGLVPPVL